MNLKKLLTLSAAALMVGTVAVGCGNGVDATETLTSAAEYVWQMYRSTDGKSVTASFDVVNKVVVGNETVTVTWTIEAEGSKDAFSLTKKNDNFSTVNVGYYDGKVTVESNVKLVPTFTYGDKTLTLADVYVDEQAKHAIDFITPVLTLHNHTDWDKNDGSLLNIKGVVVDVISKDSGSSSAGSIYMVDAEGNGYYVYKPTSSGAKTGDEIIVSGSRSDYSGQEEFGEGASYAVVSSGKESSVSFTDGSADWEAATTNKNNGELGAKYQNIPVKLEKCTPTRVDSKYYYFKVGNGTVEYNIYDNNYFLSDDQISAWKAIFEDAVAKGYTLTIEGIATVYSSAYQVYPTSLKAHVLTKEAELTVDEKHALVENALKGAILESYEAATEISFEVPSYATVTLAVTAPTENPTVVVEEGKLVVTPTPVETTNTVKATVKIGESTKEVELTVKTVALKYAGYVGTAKVADLVGSEKADKEYVLKAVTYDGAGEVDVTFNVKNLYKNHSAVYFDKNVDGDVLTITAPEGYVISKLEIEQYGTHDNFKFHAGADATGTEIDHTLTGSLLEATPNVAQVTIDNPSGYNCSFYDVKVTVSKTEVGLTNASLLGFAGSNVAYGDGTSTVDGVEMKYIQVACFQNNDDKSKNDGLQMRNKTSSGGVASSIQNTSAIESGIKSVKLTFAETKSTYDNEGMMKFEFSNNADFSEAETVLMNTVKGTKEYEVTASVATYKYVRITNNLGYTTYWDSIVIDY